MGENLETTSATESTASESAIGATISESPVKVVGDVAAGFQAAVTPEEVIPDTKSESYDSKVMLFNQVRELKRNNFELEQKLDQTNRRIEALENRFGNFMTKIGETFSAFFRPKGVNLANEARNVNTNVSDEASYMENRPDDSANNMEAYKMDMRKNGYTEDEINKRVATITGARPFEGGYNLDPENQSKAPQEEISMEDYYTHRPTFTDWQKEQIANAGGVTPEVAQASSAMRERMNTEEKPKAPVMDRIGQTVSQAFKPQGVNMDSANQIKKEDFKSLGDAVQAKGSDDYQSYEALGRLYFGNSSQTQQPARP